MGVHRSETADLPERLLRADGKVPTEGALQFAGDRDHEAFPLPLLEHLIALPDPPELALDHFVSQTAGQRVQFTLHFLENKAFRRGHMMDIGLVGG